MRSTLTDDTDRRVEQQLWNDLLAVVSEEYFGRKANGRKMAAKSGEQWISWKAGLISLTQQNKKEYSGTTETILVKSDCLLIYYEMFTH